MPALISGNTRSPPTPARGPNPPPTPTPTTTRGPPTKPPSPPPTTPPAGAGGATTAETAAVPVAGARGNRPARDASREMVCHAATVGVAQPAIVRMDDEARPLERTARVQPQRLPRQQRAELACQHEAMLRQQHPRVAHQPGARRENREMQRGGIAAVAFVAVARRHPGQLVREDGGAQPVGFFQRRKVRGGGRANRPHARMLALARGLWRSYR